MKTIIERTAEAAGFTFDLSLTWIDTYGDRWTWTGDTDESGMAVMQRSEGSPRRLSYVYWTFGPLIPAPHPVTYADRRAALTATSCTAPDEQDEKATPLTLAGLLGRLRRRSA
ncbi:phiSA1p31-related protein [Streptomyces sp. NPDC048211]|uniref:phiSA1p31-related protein n=1 Tax=Streptomyces sp. NPDC048211 TaxID=3365516 RepID=UPI00372449CB